MASTKYSAASPEESSVVQVSDSNEPLVAASSSVRDSAQVSLMPSSAQVPSVFSSAQAIDSSEPLGSTSTQVQVLDSDDPLALSSSSSLEEPVAGPSNVTGLSGLAGPDGSASTDSNEASRMADTIMPIFSSTSADDVEILLPSGSSGRRVHLHADEIRSMWTWKKVFTRLGSNEQCVRFAEERGLIPMEKLCSYHRRPMTVTTHHGHFGRFRCHKSNCRTRAISRATGTWFENAHLALPTIFHLMYAFSQGQTHDWVQKQLSDEDEPVLSLKTIVDWYGYCREVVVIYTLEHATSANKIGGPNKIVQIGESKFGRRKYNRGRQIEGKWVIGMIEDGSDDLRLEVCPDNEPTAELLVLLIKKHVQEGSIIHTDSWTAYQCLSGHGYIHKTVNHSAPMNKFVASDGTHTQRIQSQWRPLKKLFRQQHNKSDFTDWLVEYSWRRNLRINFKDPFEELLSAIKHVYKTK